MLVAQALAEYGATAALMDGIASARDLLVERVSDVDPMTWGILIVVVAVVWILFLRR